MPRILQHCLVFGLLVLPGWAPAAQPQRTDTQVDDLVLSAGFLPAHPDLHFRQLGLAAFNREQYEEALHLFKRAGYFGDKPSQGMVAEMYWLGKGVAQDKAIAYAWMDLAAERGYRNFLGQREHYWSALSEAEQVRALSEGRALYARYGDAATTPRITSALRRGKNKSAGSRTGYTGNMKIVIAGPGGGDITIDGSQFYNPKYWDPEKYRAWQDSIWKEPKMGLVQVGDVEKVEQPMQPAQPASKPSR